MSDHPFYVPDHPKPILNRTLEIVNASKKQIVSCKTHGEDYPLCTNPHNMNIKYQTPDGYGIVRTDKHIFNGVFQNNVMLFGFMNNYRYNKDRIILCRATIAGEILSESITLNNIKIQELSYLSFCMSFLKKKELWCYKNSTSQMCIDSIFFEKTERSIEIWCESSEYRIILFNSTDSENNSYALCGIPIYDKQNRAYAIRGRGWSQMPDNLYERMISCTCSSLGGCSCMMSIKPTNTFSIWGTFNKEGLAHGNVHIKHSKYNFIGHYKTGKWHGEGYLELIDEQQTWRGHSFRGTFNGIIYIKEWFASKLVGIIAGKCIFEDFKIQTIIGEYIRFSYSNSEPEIYYKGSMSLNKSDITELYGHNACMYRFNKQHYIENFDTCKGKLLTGFIEQSMYKQAFKDLINNEFYVLSNFRNISYDESIPMQQVQIAYKVDGTFEVNFEHFPDYVGQIKLIVDQNNCWNGFLYNKQPSKYRVIL